MPPNTPEQAKQQIDNGLDDVNEAAAYLRADGWHVKFVLEGYEATGDIEYEPITKLVTLE